MNATSAAGDSGTGGGGSEAVAPAWIQDATQGVAGAAAAVGGAAQIHGTSTTVNGTIVVHHTLGSAFHAAPNAVADRTNVSHEHRGGMAHHNLQQRLHPSDRHTLGSAFHAAPNAVAARTNVSHEHRGGTAHHKLQQRLHPFVHHTLGSAFHAAPNAVADAAPNAVADRTNVSHEHRGGMAHHKLQQRLHPSDRPTLGSAFHAAPNAVADGTNVSHEHRGGKAHQNLQPSSTASSKTAGDNGEPSSKASSKPPRVVKGFNGVPFIPHDLVPLRDVDNTVEYAEKIHECSFVFDPTRKEIWDNNSPPHTDQYNRTVTHIAMVIKRAKTLGREIIMNNVFENFTAIGLTVADGVPVDSEDRVIQFINSQGVMELFKNHPLLLMGILFWIFSKDTSSRAIFDAWFPDKFWNAMRTDRQTPLDFDNFVTFKSRKTPNSSKFKTRKVPNNLLAIAKNAAVKCFHRLEDLCDANFGVHLGLRKMNTKECKEKYYPPIEVNLGRFNPQCLKTYVFIVKRRYPQLAFLKRDPKIQDLYDDNKSNVSPCACPAFQLALAAADQGKTEDEVVEIIRQMYRVGGRHPIIAPPREIDAEANAAVLEEYKKAAMKAVHGDTMTSRRIATTTKKGQGLPGWDVDGNFEAEIKTEPAGIRSFLGHTHAYQAYQQWISHNGGDVNEAARMNAPTVMAPAPPMKTTCSERTPQGHVPGVQAFQQWISNYGRDVNEAARMNASTVMAPAPPMKTTCLERIPQGHVPGILNDVPSVKTPQGNTSGGCVQGTSNARGHSHAGQDETSGDGFTPIKKVFDTDNSSDVNQDILNVLVNHFVQTCLLPSCWHFPNFLVSHLIAFSLPCRKSPSCWSFDSPLKIKFSEDKGRNSNLEGTIETEVQNESTPTQKDGGSGDSAQTV